MELAINFLKGKKRMGKIRYKLFVSFILITLVTIMAVGLLLNISFHGKFTEYVKSNLNEKHQNVIEYIKNSLNNQASTHMVFMNVGHFSVMENVRVQMFKKDGEEIFDSIYSEKMMFPNREIHQNISKKAYQTESWIKINGRDIKVRIISQLSDGFWSPNDITFREAIIFSLIGSVTLGILLAILFSYFLSSRITEPITRLKNASSLISRGNWNTRVDIQSHDELEELGESFNKMAKDLEHFENLRRKMTADLAHELRNPLMSIQNYIEGMLDDVIEPDKNHLNDLHEEVERLTSLIDDLQKLAKVEGNRQIKPCLVQLAKEFEPYFERFKLNYDKENIKFSWIIDDVKIKIDKFIMKGILQNLLENALKYTPNGGNVKCEITEKRINDKDGLIIRIKDSGIGIAEKDLPYIFERFYRADPSRSRQTGGTGIGLAVTKELLELLNGKIEVKSKLGEGSEFTVFIPLIR